ncbi:MAG: hypothetical protein Q7S51_06580 [Gallionellaceae bacterium]|nr:hypothetical protein [Gallionellaceae bacterium]
MPLQLLSSPFLIAALVLGVMGIAMLGAGVVSLRHAHLLRSAYRTLLGLLLLALGGLAGAVSLGMQGYQALTQEELAARISIIPAGPQRFSALFHYPDGRSATFIIAGDDIYVDAHILKWKPWANLLGLHTAYELDRVAGRYHSIEQERNAERTLYSLAQERPVDIFGLRQRHAFLEPLLDASYGSATFLSVTQLTELELRISTTGLLMREAKGG